MNTSIQELENSDSDSNVSFVDYEMEQFEEFEQITKDQNEFLQIEEPIEVPQKQEIVQIKEFGEPQVPFMETKTPEDNKETILRTPQIIKKQKKTKTQNKHKQDLRQCDLISLFQILKEVKSSTMTALSHVHLKPIDKSLIQMYNQTKQYLKKL